MTSHVISVLFMQPTVPLLLPSYDVQFTVKFTMMPFRFKKGTPGVVINIDVFVRFDIVMSSGGASGTKEQLIHVS